MLNFLLTLLYLIHKYTQCLLRKNLLINRKMLLYFIPALCTNYNRGINKSKTSNLIWKKDSFIDRNNCTVQLAAHFYKIYDYWLKGQRALLNWCNFSSPRWFFRDQNVMILYSMSSLDSTMKMLHIKYLVV